MCQEPLLHEVYVKFCHLSASDTTRIWLAGEGEHKIMQFIRLQRAQPDYDPNTRHPAKQMQR